MISHHLLLSATPVRSEALGIDFTDAWAGLKPTGGTGPFVDLGGKGEWSVGQGAYVADVTPLGSPAVRATGVSNRYELPDGALDGLSAAGYTWVFWGHPVGAVTGDTLASCLDSSVQGFNLEWLSGRFRWRHYQAPTVSVSCTSPAAIPAGYTVFSGSWSASEGRVRLYIAGAEVASSVSTGFAPAVGVSTRGWAAGLGLGATLGGWGIWQGEKDAAWHLSQAQRCGVA